MIFSLILVMGCAHPEPVFVTAQGFNVFCEEKVCFSKEVIEIAVDLTVFHLADRVPESFVLNKIKRRLKKQKNWHSFYIRKKRIGNKGSCATSHDPERRCAGIKCGTISSTGWCAGYTTMGVFMDLHVVKYDDCLAASSMVHEIIHAIGNMMNKEPDGSHSSDSLWKSACTEEKYPNKEDRRLCKLSTVEYLANQDLCLATCGGECDG